MKLSVKIAAGSFAALCVVLSGLVFANPGRGQEKEDEKKEGRPMVAPVAKISPVQAMKTATSKAGGKAFRATYEFEDGHWIYGVMVVKKHSLMEVEIDATTGKVGDTETVTPAGEAKEYQQELAQMAKLGG